MEVRDVLRHIQRTWLFLVPLFGQAMALSDTDLKAILGTLIPVAVILMVVATIFIIRYYKKLKEVKKINQRKDAQEMMMMRDKFGHMSPHSAISSVTGTRVPEIMVNGQPKPEMQSRLGKSDWTWTPENGQVKRPTPALPGVVAQKQSTGVAKMVGKKKSTKHSKNDTATLPYPPIKQSLYAKSSLSPLPFEDQVMSIDMASEPGDVNDRAYDNDAFADDDKPASPTADREVFMMQRLTDELNAQDVHETCVTSKNQGDSLNPHVKVDVEDFESQVNEDEINGEVDPTKTIPSEVYYSERLYQSVERPKPLALPEVEIVLELVEMMDFSSLVYARDIEEEYARLEEVDKPKLAKAESVASISSNDFNVQWTADGILSETQQSRVMQQLNIPLPPIPAKQEQPFLAAQMMPPPQPIYPIQAQAVEQKQRPKSAKSNKSSKSNKSNKSHKSHKSDKSKKSKKMVPKRQVENSDFVAQCHEDDIARETGFVRSTDNDVYAEVQRHKQPVVPPKNFKEAPHKTQAEIPIPRKDAYDLYPANPEEDRGELVIPDMGLFDLDEKAMRHHHIRLKKHGESHTPHERHDSTGSMSDDNRLSADAEEKVNAAFASIFRDHSRGLTSDSSEDELERPRTPRTPVPPRAPSPPPPSPPPLAAPITQDQLLNEELDKQEPTSKKPEPVPSTSKISPNVEQDRLRHDEAHDVESGKSNPNHDSGNNDMDCSDYEHNWGKLTDDTLPRQDY